MNAYQGGCFFFRPAVKVFSKPALSLPEQIKRLQDRGLKIPDLKRAEHYLTYIGYYHLSAYALTFQQLHVSSGEAGPDKPFRPGTTFEDILSLYIFDRELRLLVMDAVERIEIAFRACVVNEMSTAYGSHWFMDAGLFRPEFKHSKFIREVEEDLQIEYGSGKRPKIGRDHHETFINHYYEQYEKPHLPPAWMLLETFSLGKLSLVFSNLRDAARRKAIAARLGADEFYLGKFMHALTYLRNLCAHHSRLWNRRFVIKPVSFKRQKEIGISNQYLAAQFIILHDLLKHAAPDSRWDFRIEQLLGKYKPNLRQMGFEGMETAEFFQKLRQEKSRPESI